MEYLSGTEAAWLVCVLWFSTLISFGGWAAVQKFYVCVFLSQEVR